VNESNVIALFPLHTVLFPGGPLPLRIFETRYTDMVRRCMREQQPFGVVLIQDGEEAGEVATTATVGCTARIADFHTLHDGLLGISCVGDRRFRVLRVWRAADGLNMGEVSWLPAERELALPQRYGHLADTVRRAIEDLAEHYEHVERRFEDASWIGARLTELLPIELDDKQALLELEDPIERLDMLLAVVPTPE
jgi:Lon protease-like protein